jgi:hypothetical protein
MVSIPRMSHHLSPFRLSRRAHCWLFLALLVATTATAADDRPSPHRLVPAKNLIACIEFEGLDAHAAAWKRTAVHAALNKTKAGAMISELARQGAVWLVEENVPFVTGADALALQEHLIRRGFTIAVHSFGHDAFSEMYILHDFKSNDLLQVRKDLKRLVKFVGLPAPTRIKGRDVYVIEDNDDPVERGMDDEQVRLPFLMKPARARAPKAAAPWITAWFEGDDLIIVWGPSEAAGDVADPNVGKSSAEMTNDFVAASLDAADGKQPNIETNASYRAARAERNELEGFEPAGLFFVSPTGDKGLITALLGIGEKFDAQTAQSAPTESRRADTSPDPSPKLDEEIRKVTDEAESLPPVFTEEELEFLKPEKVSAKPSPEIKRPVQPAQNDENDIGFNSAQIEAIGFNGLNRVVGRFGFQGEAFVTDLRIEAPSPRKGINAWFDQPTFHKYQLPPLPQGVATFAVGSLDVEATYRHIVETSMQMDPSVGEELRQFEKIVHDETNVRFREDLLKYLGPTWCVYLAPPGPGDHKPGNEPDPAAFVIHARIKDATAFGRVLDTMASYINENNKGATPDETPFLERLPAPESGYRLTSRAAVALGLGDRVEPTIMVGKSFVALAATPKLAREALASEIDPDRRWKPTGKLVSAFEGLPDDLTFLAVADHRSSNFAEKIAALPHMTQVLINMSQEDDLDHASPWCLLDWLGVPRPGGFQVKIDRSQIPSPDDLRPFLSPSILAATVDERGCRLISRGAFPFALLANETEMKYWFGAGWTMDEGFRFKEKIDFTIFGFDPTEW